MSFWELLGVVVSSAGLFASILGAFLTYAARKNGEATRELIRAMEERTNKHFTEMDKRANERHGEVTELLERMDRRADERHREVADLLDRMDRRADERHREAI